MKADEQVFLVFLAAIQTNLCLISEDLVNVFVINLLILKQIIEFMGSGRQSKCRSDPRIWIFQLNESVESYLIDVQRSLPQLSGSRGNGLGTMMDHNTTLLTIFISYP